MSTVDPQHPVAYFCAEYGLEKNLPLYAGGLGVLAGDTLKEAADQNFPMVAVGLLYRGGNARTKVDESGWQVEENVEVDPVTLGFEHVYLPHQEQPLFVRVHLTTVDVWARVWKKTIKSVTLYLLDTNTDQNQPDERDICKALYFGTDEDLLKQQLLLGIGGVKLLEALEIHPALYHINEGRPAFLFWQLTRSFIEKSGGTYQQASDEAKKLIVYTNHTLVRAGNQAYELSNLKEYGYYYAEKMGISIDELLKPGIDPSTNTFSMTQFALNVSIKASAVSRPHYELSKSLWPEFEWVSITNGVHLPTWQDHEIVANKDDLEALWHVHLAKKRQTMEFIQNKTGFGYDPSWLVLTWARRIALYKRLNTLFEDVERLKSVLTRVSRPVQLIVSGKAHPQDSAAKQLLQRVIGFMKDELKGHVLFVPDYSMEVAQQLVVGSDVWLNTPIQGQEASGTSGMKAAANGVLQLTVEDGWAAEVDWHTVGWTLDDNHLSDTFFFRMEHDVIPTYYHRNERDVPVVWLERMKRTLEVTTHYNTTRMLKEYEQLLYS